MCRQRWHFACCELFSSHILKFSSCDVFLSNCVNNARFSIQRSNPLCQCICYVRPVTLPIISFVLFSASHPINASYTPCCAVFALLAFSYWVPRMDLSLPRVRCNWIIPMPEEQRARRYDWIGNGLNRIELAVIGEIEVRENWQRPQLLLSASVSRNM